MRGIAGTLVVGLLLSMGVNVRAATVTATSCSASDVQAALNRASAGDTVYIPAGTCRWATGVSWTAPANVTLRGAGNLSVLGGGGATVIIDDYASQGALLHINTNATGTFRLAGISFHGGNSGSYIKSAGVVKITGSSHQMRVDHVYFNMRSYSPVNILNTSLRFFGWVYGVVDNSVWDLSGGTHALKYSHESYNNETTGAGDASWAAATGFGTNAFIFAENNVFNGNATHVALNDCNAGGRFVVRFNRSNGAQMQTHPTGGAGRGRGCRASEVYGNTMSHATPEPAHPPFNVYFLSSGPALIWGNTVDDSFKNFITLHSMRRNNGTYPEAPTPSGWGYCGTSFNGTGSNWDGNTNASSGYPCLDQPGRGRGDLLAGNFPNAVNTRTGGIAWPNQALEPVREWLNTFTPAPGWGGSFWSSQSSDVLAANRDYYLYTSSFTGATGNGAGPRASRPSTCTAGVAYWATDQGGDWNKANASASDGTLDVCTAANTWTNGVYTPYTYPHPLTGGAITETTAPASPTNVRIVG